MSSRDHPDWWRPMGGQNSQDSILERRSLVWNDSDPQPPPAAPPSSTPDTYKGKFFPRGCRGMIEEIQIYRTVTAAGTITLGLSPHPGLGPLYTVVIPAGPADAWTGVAFEEMWNYDSLFIWVSELEAGEEWGYDAVQPQDGHVSVNLGRTWADQAIRPFIRAVYTGETPGDVPVSGTLNTIEVPAVGGAIESEGFVNCPDAVITNLVTFYGAGTLTMARVRGSPAVNPDYFNKYYQMTVFADGVRAFTVDNLDITQNPTAASGRSSIGELAKYPGTPDDYMVMNVRLPVKFRRSLLLRFRQKTGGAMQIAGELCVNAQR